MTACFKLRFSIFLGLIIFTFSTSLYSQKISNSYISDSTQFWSIVKEHNAVLNKNPDSALSILQRAAKFIEKPQNIKLKALYLLNKGNVYRTKNQVTVAFPYFNEAYQIFSSLGDKKYCNLTKIRMGVCYMIMGQYNRAKENLINSLKYFESVADSEKITNIYLNLSFIANDLNEDSEMESYLLKGLTYANTDNTIGKIYNNLGIIYLKRNLFAKSLQYFQKALYRSNKAGDWIMASLVISNFGEVYMNQHLNDSAMFYFKKSILSEKNIDNYVLSRVYRFMASIEKELGNFQNAMLYINKSISLAKKDSMGKVISEDYNWLAEYYSSNHNFEKAYYYKTQSALINDSLLTETKIRQTKEIEAIYQNEKKQGEINLLSEQNKVATLKLRNNRIFLVFLSISLLLIIGLSVLITRQNKLKADNKSLELEHKLLRSQMNPHFIFNALAAIQNQVINKPAIEAASYLAGFAKLMRSILYNSRSETIPLSQEVETLEEYLKLQKLRLKERLNYCFMYQLNDDISEIAIPPMLLQPFLENAVEHGIAKKDIQGGNMWISFIQAKDTLTVTIEDDGIGLHASSLSNHAGHASLATRITEERMQALSKKFKSKFLFSVENRLSNNAEIIGAKVILQLPLLFVTN